MLISFHGGHSLDYCDHAADSLIDILDAYRQAGFTHVGITEHLPASEERFLYPEEIQQSHSVDFLEQRFSRLFFETRDQIKRIYSSYFHLLVGFETEWYGPNAGRRINEAIQKYSPEIVVASVHHVKDIPIDFSWEAYSKAIAIMGGLDELWANYYDHQYELIQSLSCYSKYLPIIVGHLDLIKIYAIHHQYSKKIWCKIQRNIDFAIETGMFFELNARAYKKKLGEPYPAEAMLQYIAKRGGNITLGDDAHSVKDVGAYLDKAQKLAAQYFDYAIAFEQTHDSSELSHFNITKLALGY